jgi:hypothetical protein
VTWKKVHAVFNKKYLSPFIPTQYPSQRLPNPPPPIITNDGEEYVIKESWTLNSPEENLNI